MSFAIDLADRFAVSTWSLHRALGGIYPYRPDGVETPTRQPAYGEGVVELIDLPRQCAEHDIFRLEICSFHLPSRLSSYVADLRSAAEEADVKVQTLLIEDGDLSDPETARRDAKWMAGWIDTAVALGAENMRVIAGKAQPSDAALHRAEIHLRQLAEEAADAGVRLVIENWFDLLPGPAELNRVLDALNGKVGLNGDFGNWDYTVEGAYQFGNFKDRRLGVNSARLDHSASRFEATTEVATRPISTRTGRSTTTRCGR